MAMTLDPFFSKSIQFDPSSFNKRSGSVVQCLGITLGCHHLSIFHMIPPRVMSIQLQYQFTILITQHSIQVNSQIRFPIASRTAVGQHPFVRSNRLISCNLKGSITPPDTQRVNHWIHAHSLLFYYSTICTPSSPFLRIAPFPAFTILPPQFLRPICY